MWFLLYFKPKFAYTLTLSSRNLSKYSGMLNKDYLTLQETAKALGKSAQTVRRMIKKGELKAQRMRTPQGFNYMILGVSLGRESIGRETQKLAVEPPALVNALAPIQNPYPPLVDATKQVLTSQNIATSQNEMLLSRSAVENSSDSASLGDAVSLGDFGSEDYFVIEEFEQSAISELREAHHKEKLMLFNVLEAMQTELNREKGKSKSVINRVLNYIFR